MKDCPKCSGSMIPKEADIAVIGLGHTYTRFLVYICSSCGFSELFAKEVNRIVGK